MVDDVTVQVDISTFPIQLLLTRSVVEHPLPIFWQIATQSVTPHVDAGTVSPGKVIDDIGVGLGPEGVACTAEAVGETGTLSSVDFVVNVQGIPLLSYFLSPIRT